MAGPGAVVRNFPVRQATFFRIVATTSFGSQSLVGYQAMILAVFADEDGREGVGEGFAVAGGDADVEKLCNRGEIFFCGSGEVPVEELLVGVVAGVGAAVAAEDFGGVVGGIEADAEEVGLVVERGVGGEGFVDVGEVAAHAGAEVGELAAGVDEGHQDELALELIEVDGAVALVEEVEVGNGIAGRGDVVGDGRLVVGAGLGDDDDVVELDVGVAVAVLVGEDLGGDAVAGVEFAGDAGVLELVVHGHGFHEAGDVLAVERDVVAVGGDDLAADGEGLLLR